MRRVLPFSAAIAVLCLSGTALAAAKHPSISISPAHPKTTDRAITVSYRVASKLPSGYHYQVALVSKNPLEDTCASNVTQDVTKNPKKGSAIHATVNAKDDSVAQPGSAWCPGAAVVSVYKVKNGATAASGKPLSTLNFKFS